MGLTGLPEKIYIAAYKEWRTSHQIQQLIYGYREKKITKYLTQYAEKGYFDHEKGKWRSTTKGLLEEISHYIPLDEGEIQPIISIFNDDSFRKMIDYHKDKKPSLLKMLNIIQTIAFIIDKLQTEGWLNNIQPNKQEAETFKTKFNQKMDSSGYGTINWKNIPLPLLAWAQQFCKIHPSIIKKLRKLPQHEVSQDLIYIARSTVPIKD